MDNTQKKDTQTTEKPVGKSEGGFFSIRNKITVCFLVPILFMVIIGLTAYIKAENGMEENFRDSTIQTLNMAVEYVEMSCSFIESESMKYLLDSNLNKYSMGLMKNSGDEQTSVYNTIRSNMLSAQVSNPFISQIHIVTPRGVNMLSTQISSEDGILEDYLEEASGEDQNLNRWTDRHDALDKHLSMRQDNYIMAYQIMNQANTCCIVIDMKQSAIQEFLEGLDLGDGSIVGFVTEGGREVVCENTEENGADIASDGAVFSGQDFMPTAGDEPSGYRDVNYNGSKYLFLYSKSQKTGVTLCALVPRRVITGQAEEIKRLTILII
ncbi:MAG: cache domain-containing protein, partial [Acetatifactor sp.]|nr:cache domain-containing protein [Acetatifactor sp.]